MSQSIGVTGNETLKIRAREAAARAQVYRFLSTVFAKEPSAEFLTLLQSESLSNLRQTLDINLPVLDSRSSLEREAETLACEYTRLFVGPGKHISPYESVARGEGRLWGEATTQVQSIYEECGFTIQPTYKDMPDHVSAELEFIAHACEMEARRWVSGKQNLLKTVVTIEIQFMDWHLLKWASEFLDQVQQNSDCAYYRELSRAAKTFLIQDREYLRKLLVNKFT